MRFRKLPVEIDAIQFTGLDDYLHIVQWMKDSGDTYALANEVRYQTPLMLIQTLEGTMAANPGDWIIRGVQGEFYPCKPDVFAATYEPVEEEPCIIRPYVIPDHFGMIEPATDAEAARRPRYDDYVIGGVPGVIGTNLPVADPQEDDDDGSHCCEDWDELSSHYHCARCHERTSMMGHLSQDGTFSCGDPT